MNKSAEPYYKYMGNDYYVTVRPETENLSVAPATIKS